MAKFLTLREIVELLYHENVLPSIMTLKKSFYMIKTGF